MILSHFTETPAFTLDPKREYRIELDNWKPAGIWLSDEVSNLGWRKWCSDEGFRQLQLKYEHTILCDAREWVVINNEDQFCAFHDEFQRPLEIGDKFSAIQLIDWARVKKRYKGILITPYQWEFRLTHMWYYGWDCASACVWDCSTLRYMGTKEILS